MHFFRNLIKQPKITGSIAPSGRILARKMAAAIELNRAGPVIELGPGTGVVTKEILNIGVKPTNLTAIECNKNFCELLRHQFNEVNIIEGNAIKIKDTLPQVNAGTLASIISSLPLLYSPINDRQTLLKESLELLQPGAPYIQFSYGRFPPIPIDAVDIKIGKSKWILTNIPPARVWIYRKKV